MQKQFQISLLFVIAILVFSACVAITPTPEITPETDSANTGGTIPAPEAGDGSSDSPDTAPDVIEATFVCPDGTRIDTVFDNSADTVTFTLPDETITLPRAVSGSGARYSDGTTTFWNNGNEALVEVNGETIYEGCVAEEDNAAGSAETESSAIVDVT